VIIIFFPAWFSWPKQPAKRKDGFARPDQFQPCIGGQKLKNTPIFNMLAQVVSAVKRTSLAGRSEKRKYSRIPRSYLGFPGKTVGESNVWNEQLDTTDYDISNCCRISFYCGGNGTGVWAWQLQ
jgi:hypothetical protein